MGGACSNNAATAPPIAELIHLLETLSVYFCGLPVIKKSKQNPLFPIFRRIFKAPTFVLLWKTMKNPKRQFVDLIEGVGLIVYIRIGKAHYRYSVIKHHVWLAKAGLLCGYRLAGHVPDS